MKTATRIGLLVIGLVVAVAGCGDGQTKALTTHLVAQGAAGTPVTEAPASATTTTTDPGVVATVTTSVPTTTTTTTSVPVPPPDPDAELGEFDDLDGLLDELDDLLSGL